MEIFGIGPFELALIALIAFIVLGPERIPAVMRQLGRGVRQMRKMAQDLTRDYGGDLNEITSAVDEVQNEIRGVQRDLSQAARGILAPPNEPKIGGQTRPPASPAPSPAKPDEPSSEIIDYRSDV